MVWQTNPHTTTIPAGLETAGIALCLLSKSKGQFGIVTSSITQCYPMPITYGPMEKTQPGE